MHFSPLKHRHQIGRIHKGGPLAKVRPIPGSKPVPPNKQHSPIRHFPGAHRLASPMPGFNLRIPILPMPMQLAYGNYAASAFRSPALPPSLFVSPQQIQPFILPQLIPQAQSIPIAHEQPLMMPQQITSPLLMAQQAAQAMMMPHQVASAASIPHISPPYPMATPYAQQQQIPMQPLYNNVGVSTPMSAGVGAQVGQYSTPNSVAAYTDWTGGGKISPGFLGPPI